MGSTQLKEIEMTHRVVHWEIGGEDLPGMRDFYAKAFGWEISTADPSYALVPPPDGGLAGGLMKIPPGVPPYVTVYVESEDLDASLAQIHELGGQTVVPPTVINDNASFAMFMDPGGHVIGLLQASGPIV